MDDPERNPKTRAMRPCKGSSSLGEPSGTRHRPATRPRRGEAVKAAAVSAYMMLVECGDRSKL